MVAARAPRTSVPAVRLNTDGSYLSIAHQTTLHDVSVPTPTTTSGDPWVSDRWTSTAAASPQQNFPRLIATVGAKCLT